MKGRYDEAYDHISEEDKAVRGLEDFNPSDGLGIPAASEVSMASAFMGKFSYEIGDVKIDGGTATVDVAITSPDLSQLLGELLGASLSAALDGRHSEEAAATEAAKALSSESIPTTTSHRKMNLIRESGKWRILFDWRTEEKVDSLQKESEQLAEERQWSEAKGKLLEAVALLSGRSGSDHVERRSILKKEAERLQAVESYSDSILIQKLWVEKAGWTYDAWVRGSLKNIGSRTLDYLEVTIYLLDANGDPIYEETDYPVLVRETGRGYGDSWRQPLKPNYTRRILAGIKKAPEGWAWKVKAEVTNLKFGE